MADPSKPSNEADKNAAKFPLSRTVAEQILTKAQDSRPIVQDFVPLAQSLEWELGQQYLRERGNKSFISDASPVPFIVNNDGNLSRHAAEVFFASLVEAEKTADLEPDIYVLELGIGVGLFARFFLDHFQYLCSKHRHNFYERLCYIAADKSPRMLQDVIRHGVLSNHPGRFRLREIDALSPDAELPFDAALANHPNKEKFLRAVFLNYLLDCLPAAVLEFDGDQVKELCVRTCVARNVKLEDFTDLTPDQLKQRALSSDPKARQELLEVYGLFASEYDYRPVDVAKLPHGAFGVGYARSVTKRFLLSYGAIQCLDKLLGMVHEQGFILVNDYGQTMTTREDEFEHQRFSLATFVGVNFPLLKAYYEQSPHPQPLSRSTGRGEEDASQSKSTGKGKPVWVEPHSEAGGIHSRLLCHQQLQETTIKFWECFSAARYEHLHEPVARARACAKVGRFEMAATYYNQSMERQPGNWVLLNEISMFLTFSLRDPKAGIDMAKMALTLNPTCSAELWNTLGDGLYEFGRTEEARSAYLKAQEVNDSDVRSRYNLAFCHVREKNFPAALTAIAEALALDKTGEYRAQLMQKMQDAMIQLGQRHQQEYLLLINLVSKYAKKEESKPDERIA